MTLVKHFPKLITHQCKSFQQSSLGNWRKRTDCINPLLGAAQNSSKVSSLATFAQVLLVVFSIFHLQHCLYGQVLFALPVSRCCCLAPADPHSDARHILRGCRKILVNLFFYFSSRIFRRQTPENKVPSVCGSYNWIENSAPSALSEQEWARWNPWASLRVFVYISIFFGVWVVVAQPVSWRIILNIGCVVSGVFILLVFLPLPLCQERMMMMKF